MLHNLALQDNENIEVENEALNDNNPENFHDVVNERNGAEKRNYIVNVLAGR